MPRRRTGAAVPGASGAQSLLKAVFGKRASRETEDECDPVQFPSRFTRRLQLEEEDQQEEVDDADEGENKSRLISQVKEVYRVTLVVCDLVGLT